ncbi:MAG: DUF3795 domain-containing protein [Bacteroidales bacterium]|jgi:hypothetical protein|nr:DUF3795 domain-containing protein [Bacteroidales bacterium]
MEKIDYKKLTAPCGRDCFNCPFYIALNDKNYRQQLAERYHLPEDKVVCKGCRSIKGECNILEILGYNKHCAIYKCASDNSVVFCSDCNDFPCNRLHPLADGATRFPHNLKVYNLCMIKKMGLEKWAEEQAEKSFNRYYNDKLNSCF